MNTSGPSDILAVAWRTLREQWLQSAEAWSDVVRHEFDHTFWQEFEDVVPAALRAVEELECVIERAMRSVR